MRDWLSWSRVFYLVLDRVMRVVFRYCTVFEQVWFVMLRVFQVYEA